MNNEQANDPVTGKKVAEVFGEIVWVMSRDRRYSEMTLGELESYVMPAILLRQFHITYAKVAIPVGQPAARRDGKNLQPVRVELFGMISDRIKTTIKNNDPLPRLEPVEWRSGTNRITVVDAKVPEFTPDKSLQS